MSTNFKDLKVSNDKKSGLSHLWFIDAQIFILKKSRFQKIQTHNKNKWDGPWKRTLSPGTKYLQRKLDFIACNIFVRLTNIYLVLLPYEYMYMYVVNYLDNHQQD